MHRLNTGEESGGTSCADEILEIIKRLLTLPPSVEGLKAPILAMTSLQDPAHQGTKRLNLTQNTEPGITAGSQVWLDKGNAEWEEVVLVDSILVLTGSGGKKADGREAPDPAIVYLAAGTTKPHAEKALVSLQASGIIKELSKDFVQKHADTRVTDAVQDLYSKWKEFLAYSPDFQFDNTLNSYTVQNTYKVEQAKTPTMWREDRNGGVELYLASSRPSDRCDRGDEAERNRVATMLRSYPHINEVAAMEKNMILFRTKNPRFFIKYLEQQGAKAERADAIEYVGQGRDRGPNDYICLRVGSEDDNNKFLGDLHEALQVAQREQA